MTDLIVSPASTPAADGTILDVTPASAGWCYVGFEVLALTPGVVAERDTRDREVCMVVISGTVAVVSHHGEWGDLGGRADPWNGPPDAAYLPAGTPFSVET
ncbi:MAG: 5-deoxy-glucuronate isomerase, partial [Solirubrobacteraceae bacterium]